VDGGASQFRARIEVASVSILTPAALQQWRLQYVKKAKTPAEEKSRMTSANSIMKQARCLFSEKILRFLTDIKIPDPLPFAGCEFFPRQNSRYFSRIDPRALLLKAHRELDEQSAEFLVMLLALSAGLRKGEIDTLCWSQVDFDHALIRVEPTAVASLKSQESRGEVPIDPGLCGLLRSYKRRASGDFVIEAPEGPSGPKKWGRAYRADQVFDSLYQWLRKNGVTAQKPLHELRKELGALVTTEHGIYAASRILRHSDISTTTRFYADQKSDATIKISEWLSSPRKPAGKSKGRRLQNKK
jgi:integrase